MMEDPLKRSLHPLRPSLSDGFRCEASRFIRNRTGIHQIPPLRSLSHVKRRDLRGSETAAKGGRIGLEIWEIL